MSDEKPRVLLIDLSGLFWRAWHASGRDDVSRARQHTRELVETCHQGRFGGVLTVLCCDRGKSFRKEIYPEYKAQRPDKDRMVIEELRQTESDLVAAGYLTWGVPTFEGDDIIATACKIALERGHEVTIASADKDILQLLALTGPEGERRVSVLRTHNMRVVERGDFIDAYGIPPNLFGDWLALCGDKSDNIPGVPGVGEKTASAMLRAFPGIGHLIMGAESGALEKTTGVKAGQARAVAQNIEALRLSRKLVELRFDAPIRFEEIYEPRNGASAPATNEEEDPMPPAADLTEEPTPAPATAPAAPPVVEVAPKADAPTPEAKTPPAAPQTAIVQYQGPFELALEPTSLGIGMTLADKMFESRLYARYPHKNALLVAIGRARELGFGAFVAPDLFHPIDIPGQGITLALKAIAVGALIERDPNCEYFMLIESDAEKATYEFKHKKHPEAKRFTYTIQQAVDAGMCQLQVVPRDWSVDPKTGKPDADRRGNWDKRRAEMIRKQCLVAGGRVFFPNAALGLNSVEEMTGGGDED
jgi:5'-3' exonuclease